MIDLSKDIELAFRKYPALKYFANNDKPYVAGTFMSHQKDSYIEIEQYEIKIMFSSDYPYSFPKVWEVSGKIMPRNATRHIYLDGSLCFGNMVDVARACKNGITLTWFLDEILNVHLCREYVREITGKYPTGERSHNEEGVWESYYEIFDITDKAKIFTELELILSNMQSERNDLCYCNSGKKYKICHLKIEPKVLDVGRENLQQIYQYLKSCTK